MIGAGVKKLWNGIKKAGEKVLTSADRFLGGKVNQHSKRYENDLDQHITKDQLTTEDRMMINLGKESYKESSKRERKIGSFDYDEANSNYETAIYKDKKANQAKVVHRGSVSLEDWAVTDTAIGMGLIRLTP